MAGRAMIQLVVTWFLNALALFVLPYVIPSIQVESYGTALVAALVLGFINTLIRPILVLLTLPVTLLTLGLFIFVINGLLFWFVGSFIRGFVVGGFWSGVFGAIVYSIVSWLLASLVLKRRIEHA
jgi:putative membrane protein